MSEIDVSRHKILPPNIQQNGVHRAYTEAKVLGDILDMRAAGKSLREIAAFYGKPITHGDIGRILKGVFPIGEEKRTALGLAKKCRVCYQIIHVPRAAGKKSGYAAAWLKQAADNLAALEKPMPDPVRVYGRGGKRVRV